MGRMTFSVDSRLLRELGERLVGRPHIALAELVKNAYDADATKVIIRFEDNRIEISDNGHGIDFGAFENRWMRVGSTHKETEEVSPRFHRPLTGSKGVGRLSVQLLAQEMQLHTVAAADIGTELQVSVDWNEAVDAGLLTEAPAYYDLMPTESTFPDGSSHGTTLILKTLNQRWTPDALVDLAREIWPLQPPFGNRSAGRDDTSSNFSVELDSPNRTAVEAFDQQMRAVLDLWTARLIGEMLPVDGKPPAEILDVMDENRPGDADSVREPKADNAWDRSDEFESQRETDTGAPSRVMRLTLEFQDRSRETVFYRLRSCHLDSLSFEIRVFTLAYRQPRGIRVEDARRYLRRFGGVHVYDAGFNLPYYGADTDWLRVEIDHSHRLSRSALLPESIQRSEGLNYLPTNSRLFGIVNINTSHEQRAAAAQHGDAAVREALRIQVSRDRLAGNRGYRDLVVLVRWALDFYAVREAARVWASQEVVQREEVPTSHRIERLDDTLDRLRESMPDEVFRQLSEEVRGAMRSADAETRARTANTALLASLATAGISALAYEHEVEKQLQLLTDLARRMRLAEKNESSGVLTSIANDLDEWIGRAKATRALFSHLLDEENRNARGRFKAKALVDDVARQVRLLLRGAEVVTAGVSPELRLPTGGYVEWSSLFQNLMTNAVNAMADSSIRVIDVRSTSTRGKQVLLVQDTGVGVDLDHADELFEPFVRRHQISQDRAALGLGGSGLGLTIVRMLANELRCSVRFVPPTDSFSTAVEVAWKDVDEE
jgi:signal transduction histidine kinase